MAVDFVPSWDTNYPAKMQADQVSIANGKMPEPQIPTANEQAPIDTSVPAALVPSDEKAYAPTAPQIPIASENPAPISSDQANQSNSIENEKPPTLEEALAQGEEAPPTLEEALAQQESDYKKELDYKSFFQVMVSH